MIRLASFQAEKTPTAPKAKAAATPKAKAAPRNAGLPILTLDRFEQAMQIAKLAAERDLPELNFRAVREALRRAARRADQSECGTVRDRSWPSAGWKTARTTRSHPEWSPTWSSWSASGEASCTGRIGSTRSCAGRSCRRVVPPRSSCTPRRRTLGPCSGPGAPGSMLAAWAVRAGKVDDLKRAIAERQGQTLAELPARSCPPSWRWPRVMPRGPSTALKAIAARLKRDTLALHRRARLPGRAARP